jgi:inosine/xanthosine triphosphatase
MNPVKLGAAKVGVQRACSSKTADVTGYEVASGVSDQPMDSEETKRGAINRAKAAFSAHTEATGRKPDFAVGLEGGIEDDGSDMLCSAWMCVFDGEFLGTARTASFTLPPAISALVRGGMELGLADDKVFSTVNSKQGQGAVGALTRGVIGRQEYYEPAVVLAMVPLLWKGELFPPLSAASK